MTSVKTNEVLAGVLEGRRWMHISRNVSSIVLLRSLKTRREEERTYSIFNLILSATAVEYDTPMSPKWLKFF
jgi:hypothetical protein